MKKLLLTIIILVWIQQSFAATPNWSVVPQNYQYQMTLSSKVSIGCNDLNNRTILVAAFINGECRGIDSNYVYFDGYYHTYITIYSHKQVGEAITFKLYDPALDKEYDVIDTMIFKNDTSISSTTYPYALMSNYRPTQINLSSTFVFKRFTQHTFIGKLSTIDKNNTQFKYSLLTGNYNNDYFYISNDSLYLNKDLVSDPIVDLSIKIQTDDLYGCTYDSVFKFQVVNNDPPPTGLVATDSVIFEHSPVGTLAKKLIAIDASPNENHTYELIAGEGSEGNVNFNIVGDQLLVNADMEYSTAAIYPVRIKITDRAKNTLEVKTQINLREFIYSLKLNPNTINEHVALGTVAKIFEIEDVNNSGAYSIALVEGVGSTDNYRYVIQNNLLVVNSDIEYNSSALHSVRIVVVNRFGNKIEMNANVIINETINSKQPLKANNLVTPNSDGVNELFEIFNSPMYAGFNLSIFDDHGNMTNQYNPNYTPTYSYPNTWNGMSDSGKKLPTGMYYYIFRTSDNIHVFKGNIYLIQP